MEIPILNNEQHWVCPNCPAEFVVKSSKVHSPFHPCAGLKGIQAPMVPKGTSCKVEAVEREDYIGSENVTLDGGGRPIMRVETTRDEGTDVAVFAPCANSAGGVS